MAYGALDHGYSVFWEYNNHAVRIHVSQAKTSRLGRRTIFFSLAKIEPLGQEDGRDGGGGGGS